jgi:hypothetical protein
MKVKGLVFFLIIFLKDEFKITEVIIDYKKINNFLKLILNLK